MKKSKKRERTLTKEDYIAVVMNKLNDSTRMLRHGDLKGKQYHEIMDMLEDSRYIIDNYINVV